jgi:hypothetical protein
MPRGRRPAAPRAAPVVRARLGDLVIYPPFDDEEARNRRLAAESQAEALLRECLTAGEWDQLTQRGYLEVMSPSVGDRSYRIPRTGGRPVMYEGIRPVAQLCIYPAEWLPQADVILVHLLMLRANEDQYLATANHFPM